MTRNKLIQRIHVLKRDLALDDDMYRTVLQSIAGKSSCTELDEEELNLVCLALDRMAATRRLSTSMLTTNAGQHRFIARLMDHLGWSWRDTSRFCKHQTGKVSTKQCNARELSKLIIGMIRTIDYRIEKGMLKMSPHELDEYRRHTRLHRSPIVDN